MPHAPKSSLAALALAGSLVLGGCAATPLLLDPEGTTLAGRLAGPKPVAGVAAPPAPSAAASVAKSEIPAAKPAAVQAGGTLALARALRDKGDRAKALLELERARAEKPKDRDLAREAGIVALELGQLDKARKALEAALDPVKPDWHTVSALGTAHATGGNQREAQAHFKQALAIKPDHQPTLNNLALSYALDGNLAEAEKTLKSAAATGQSTAQIQENLALVLALSGKFADAEKIAAGVMPKDKAKANMVYVRSLTQQGS